MKKKFDLKSIPTSSIKVAKRFREDFGDIDSLARQILAGKTFHTDIILDDSLTLLAGGRRLKAIERILSGSQEIWDKQPSEEELAQWKDLPCKVYYKLDDIDRLKFEFLENFGRKDFTWVECAKMVEALHTLCTEYYGKAGAGRAKKGWALEDTAKEIGVSKGEVSKLLYLAEGLNTNPELSKIKAKSVARSRLQKMKIDDAVRAIDRSGTEVFEEVHLIVGDSEEVLDTIPDGSIDLIITDPPWGIQFEDTVSDSRSSRHIVAYDGDFDLEKTLSILIKCQRKLREGGSIYLFYSAFTEKAVEAQNLLVGSGFMTERIPLIWHKKHILPHSTDKRHILAYESMHYGWKGEKPFLEGVASNVFEFQVAFADRIHSAEKPRELLEALVELSSKEGQTVLDPYGGSCQLADACLELGRKAIIIEKEEALINLAKIRIAGG